jgi:hypothetical protein
MATPTYTPIETYTVSGSSVSSVTLGSGGTIPSTYTDLIVVVNASLTSGTSVWGVRFNGDTGSNYSWTSLRGDGSSATSNRDSGSNRILCGWFGTSKSTGIVQIQNYANTTTYKTVITRSNATDSGTYVNTAVGLWRGSTGSATQAITSVTVLPDSSTWPVGSTFTLYGIANAAIGAPKATGGIITYDSTYYYHTFGASGTFTPQQSLTADILVVAGGGSGGNVYGGGGGAGGLLAFASQSLSATGYTVTVGAGGAGYDGNGYGANGNDSQFGALTLVKGGGGGGGNAGGNGATGGSGGGSSGGNSPGTPGSATSGQGFAGGSGNSNGSGFGGGGGGGGAAEAGNTDGLYEGGDGVSTYSSWGLITGTGQNVSGTVYYAGGGGGWRQYNLTTSAGGLGGGGGSGTTALVNSGGGGQANDPVTGTNRVNGGSGVVIVRYLKA